MIDVRDLWPEAAVILGELRGARAIARGVAGSSAASIAERAGDRHASPSRFAITSPSTWRRAKIDLIPNGTTQDWLEAGRAPIDRAGAGFPDDRFTWVYAGNLGIAQGLETAIEAAGLLGSEFRLVLLGGGPERGHLGELAAELPDGPVEFRDPVQPEAAAPQMRAADALFVSLAPQPELAKFAALEALRLCRPAAAAGDRRAGRGAANCRARPGSGWSWPREIPRRWRPRCGACATSRRWPSSWARPARRSPPSTCASARSRGSSGCSPTLPGRSGGRPRNGSLAQGRSAARRLGVHAS